MAELLAELWPHLLKASDLRAIGAPKSSERQDGAADGSSALPYSDTGSWPLSDAQIKLLGFETLLLTRPSPREATAKAAAGSRTHTVEAPFGEPAPTEVLRGMSPEDSAELTARLSRRMVKSLAVVEEEETPAPALTPVLEALGARVTAQVEEWLGNGEREGVSTAAAAAAAAAARPAIEGDALLEDVRLRLGIPRDVASRLSRLLLLPPPAHAWDAAAPPPPPTASERELYASVQPYVGYRLMLLQHLRPSHFGSRAEYQGFAERQLAAFTCGMLAAVRAAPAAHRWSLLVGADQSAESVAADGVEALLLGIARDELLPLISPRTIAARRPSRDAAASSTSSASSAPMISAQSSLAWTYDEAAVSDGLRRLGHLSYMLLGGMAAALSGVQSPEERLPFLRPASLPLYQSVLAVCYGVGADGLLSIPAAAELEARLAGLSGRRGGVLPGAAAAPALLLSEHTHLLCGLQRCLARWVEASAASARDEVNLRLARVLHVLARQLRAHLSRRRQAAPNLPWPEAEAADHRAVLPGALRFLHRLMLDYHASFAGEVRVAAAPLCQATCAYFELHAIAHLFSAESGLRPELCLRTADEIRVQVEEATSVTTSVTTPVTTSVTTSVTTPAHRRRDPCAGGGGDLRG